MIAPYVNSYRRLVKGMSAPVNVAWGYDNRTTGLRIPPSSPANRRVENRVPSSDANPYLALAASLACGWLGLTRRLAPVGADVGHRPAATSSTCRWACWKRSACSRSARS